MTAPALARAAGVFAPPCCAFRHRRLGAFIGAGREVRTRVAGLEARCLASRPDPHEWKTGRALVALDPFGSHRITGGRLAPGLRPLTMRLTCATAPRAVPSNWLPQDAAREQSRPPDTPAGLGAAARPRAPTIPIRSLRFQKRPS